MRTDVQTQVAPNSTVAQPASFNSGMVALTLLLPLILIASAIGYRRYRSVRLRQQIESLERIWKMTYRKTRS
jgi:hypothetical protein